MISWAVGLLIVCVLAISVIIPVVTSNISGLGATAQTGEVWNGTAGIAHTLALYPVNSITNFRNATGVTIINQTTLLSGNGSNSSQSRAFTLTNFDNGQVSGRGVNVTSAIQVPTQGGNVTAFVNGVQYANYSTTANFTYNFSAGVITTSPLTITYQFNGQNTSNVTNTSVSYPTFTTTTNYALSNAALGQITPTSTGTFYTSYTWGATGNLQAQSILTLVPLLIAVVLIVLILSGINA